MWGERMQLELLNDLVIQCDRCGEVHIIDKDSLELNTYWCERPMGDEVEYNYTGESDCQKCGNVLSYVVRGYEYPVGVFNYSTEECSGGHFVQEPEMAVDYYEFDYDYADEEIIYDDAEQARENIYRILHDHESVYGLTSREFEHLVAEVFRQQGYSVEVTQKTRDGGCDIIATRNIGGIPFMVLIECKRYDRKNHVGVQLVRSLLGVQTDRKANKGVLVTSSTFTKSARKFAERQQHYISLVDFDDLLRMMEG